MARRALALLALLLPSGLALSPAFAQDTSGAKVLMRSTAPYNDVGVLSPELSTLCTQGLFNQQTLNRLTIEFIGPVGAGVLGIAKGNGWNLSDPQGRADRTASYFFLRDGTSGCEVYYFTPAMKQKKAAGQKLQ